MATFYPVGGGAPGIDPSVLTATAGDVVAGMVAGVKDNYNPVTGTLTLTGNAQQNHVLSGETYYTTNPKSKITGTMTVQSILSFSCAPSSASQIIFTWQNPSSGPFSGVIIIGKTGGYPANISDGTRYYKGFGNNSGSLGTSSAIVGGFSLNVTYYFRAFSYCTVNNEEWVTGTTRIANTIIRQLSQTFTYSQNWTVPNGVSKVDVFLVGGGSASQYNRGGGAGETNTWIGVDVSPSQNISIIIGAGGTNYGNGNNSYFGGLSARGGVGVFYGAGNSGDSYNSSYQGRGGDGGTNGASGENWIDGGDWDTRQGRTTRAFGEPTGTLYAGGGAGANGFRSYPRLDGGARWIPYGGQGGGGNGNVDTPYAPHGDATGGAPNTGGGAGGISEYERNDDGDTSWQPSRNGGSGICIIRYVG